MKNYKTPDPKLALMIFWAVFAGVKRLEFSGVVLQPDGRINPKFPNLTSENFLYLAQNPAKNSQWAAMARAGRKVLWVIRRHDNKYVLRIIDGVIYPL